MVFILIKISLKFHFDKTEKNLRANFFKNYKSLFNTVFPLSPGVKQNCVSRHLFFHDAIRIDWKNQNKTVQRLSLFSIGVVLFCKVPNSIFITVKDE